MAKLPVRGALTLALALLLGVGACSDTPADVSASGAGGTVRLLPLAKPNASRYAVGAHRTDPDAATTSSALIGRSGGTLQIPGGHSITFPEGALSRPTMIRGRAGDQFVEVDLGPEGLEFPAGAEPTLTLSYDGALDAAGDLTIVYLSPSGAVLEDLNAQVDAGQRVVSAKLRHFSRYAVGAH